jgi:hypothetical protein
VRLTAVLMLSPESVSIKIDKFEKDLEIMISLKNNNSFSYKYLMSQIESKMDEYLKIVHALVQENKLNKLDFLDFKIIVLNKIRQESMRRGEYEFANAFEKKHGL